MSSNISDSIPNYTPIANTDHWKTDDILEIVENIHNSGSSRKEREELNKGKYIDFVGRYPMLFLMACEDNYDKKTLMYMMNMRNKILNNECSVENASRRVGEKFFGKYVSPVVDKLDKQK